VFLCRLSEQARRQLEKTSTKFEDLSLGDRRPTQLIRRYGNLYTEGRLDALDALDDVTEMTEFADLKGKLLLTILVVSLPAGHLDTDCFTCDTWIMTGFRRQECTQPIPATANYDQGRIIQCAQCAHAHETPPHWRPHHQANVKIVMLKFVVDVGLSG